MRIEGGATGAVTARAASPAPAEPVPMPAYDGLGLHEDQGRSPPPPRGRQDHPKYAVAGAEIRPLHGTLQGPQLVSEGNIFEDDVLVPAAGQGDCAEEQHDQFEHRSIMMRMAVQINADSGRMEFWRTTGGAMGLRYFATLSSKSIGPEPPHISNRRTRATCRCTSGTDSRPSEAPRPARRRQSSRCCVVRGKSAPCVEQQHISAGPPGSSRVGAGGYRRRNRPAC